jgi:hypothetical protein
LRQSSWFVVVLITWAVLLITLVLLLRLARSRTRAMLGTAEDRYEEKYLERWQTAAREALKKEQEFILKP